MAYQSSIGDVVNVPIVYGKGFLYMINKDAENSLVCNCNKNITSDMGAGQEISEGHPYTITIQGHLCGELSEGTFYPDPNPMEFPDNELVYATGYLTASDGDFVLSKNPVVSDDTEIVAVNYTTDNIEMYPYGFGTVNEMRLGEGYTYSYEFTATTVEIGELQRIDNIHLHLSYDDWENNLDITYFFVPVQIGSGSSGSSMPSSIATVLPIIPLVVVIGIIMAGIGMIRVKN